MRSGDWRPNIPASASPPVNPRAAFGHGGPSCAGSPTLRVESKRVDEFANMSDEELRQQATLARYLLLRRLPCLRGKALRQGGGAATLAQ